MIVPASNHLYIQGYPAFDFDGQDLNALDFYGYFVAVDSEQSIYYSDSFNSRFTLSKQRVDGRTEQVGNAINGIGGNLHNVEFYNGFIIVIGVDYSDGTLFGTTLAYMLDDEKWGRIPTDHVIYDVISFENKFFAFVEDGEILELIQQPTKSHTFPEMNHNELAGWRFPENLMPMMQPIYLYSDHDHERVEKRMEICRDIFEKKSNPIIDIIGEGASLLEQYYYLIHLTDWISFYLAKENGIDPDPSESVLHVRKELERIK